MPARSFPVLYANDVEREARFWELIGFRRHIEYPGAAGPGYVGLRTEDAAAEVAVTHAHWATERYGLTAGGGGPRFEMFVYVADLDAQLAQLRGAGVKVLREPEDMGWGERIATVADPEGNPVALGQAPKSPTA